MTYVERKEKIMELLADHEMVSKKFLEGYLNASESTIRRDLFAMEQEQVLVRYWGGAKQVSDKTIYRRKIQEQSVSEEMRLIGETAAGFLGNSELIFLGSGKTTLAMIEYIKVENLSVITNGIPQIEALYKRGIQAFLLCGAFKEYSRAVVGRQTIQMLSTYKFDKAFMGTRGLNENLAPLSGDEYEYDIKNICIQNSTHSFILADHTKFNRSAMYAAPSEYSERISIISDKKVDSSLGFKNCEPGMILKKNEISHN